MQITMKISKEQHFLLLFILIRLIFIVLCIVGDHFVKDHEAEGVEHVHVTFSSPWTKLLLGPFVKWDAAHYINISSKGYNEPFRLVFYPFLPYVLKVASKVGMPLMNAAEASIAWALIWNAFASTMGLNALRQLLHKHLRHSVDVVDAACLCYIFSPASVFFTSVYTEPSFLMFSFYGLMYMHKNMLLSSLCLTFASFVRSNGVLNGIIVCVYFLQAAYKLHLNKEPEENDKAKVNSKSIFSLASAGLVLLLSCVLPTFLMTSLSWVRLCHYLPQVEPEYCQACNNSILCLQLPYSYLQKKYWNVYFLSFYQVKQIPNILLAFPILVYTLHILYLHYQYFGKQKLATFLLHPSLPYLLHILALLVTLLGWAHVQICTRVLCSASPLVYLALAEGISSPFSLKRNSTWVFLLLYGVGGAVAHVNFYPWT